MLLVTAVVCSSCTTKKEKIPPANMEASSDRRVVIYQIMTRLFGNKVTTHKPHGTKEENGVGKFNDINDAALKSIKEMGITHVWYTGVIEHATLSDYREFGIPLDDADVVKGRAGSPYAIKDYYDVAPDLAVNVKQRMNEFEKLVDRTHANGLKVLIDFVPNHVARFYHSDAKPNGVKDFGTDDDKTITFNANNNFYYLPGESFQVPKGYTPIGKGNIFPTLDGKFEETPAKATGNDQFTASPGINEWFETVKLNYGIDIQNQRQRHFDPIPNTWLKMKDILIYWTNKKVDGFRCDMAEMVPVEFWGWVIPQLKVVNPDLVFIAEIYNPSQYKNYITNGHFNYLYDKVELYDTLRLLLEGKSNTRAIHEIHQRQQTIDKHLVHFMENHDEQRLASKYFANGIWKAMPAMVVSATLDRGPLMIYFGQEVGEAAAGAEGFSNDDGRTSIFDYCHVPEHQKWMNGGKFNGDSLSLEQKQLRQLYSDLLALAGQNAALTHGDYIDITAYNIDKKNFTDEVIAFMRYTGEEKLLIIAGFNEKPLPVTIQISPAAVAAIGLDPTVSYIARDMLHKNDEVGFDKNLGFPFIMKPYSAYIFKLK